jgi:hypothetical protein
MELGRTRRLRWAVPAGAVITVAALIAATAAAAAQPAPSLPSRTAAQLLAAVARAAGPVPLTGTYTETAQLGLPDLPGSGDPGSGLGLLAGPHTFMIWSGGEQELRIAEPVPLGEADVRQFGNQVWLWDSRTQHATHIVLPATFGSPATQPSSSQPSYPLSGAPSPSASPSGRAAPGAVPSGPASPGPASPDPGQPAAGPHPLTPQQLGRRILAAIGPTTAVSVRANVTVAGQPAYQLALAPKDRRSLIGHVTIAIDARHHLPLSVRVFARGAARPAFQAGYTALSFGVPAVSNFMFTPPPGATVKTINVPAGSPRHFFFRHRPGGPPGSATAAPSPPPATAAPSRPPATADDRSGHSASSAPSTVTVDPATGQARPAVAARRAAGQHLHGPAVLGTGWLAVLVVPPWAVPGASPAAGSAVYGDGGDFAGGAGGPASPPAAITATGDGTPAAAPGPAGGAAAALRALLKAATPVHGTWGSGRLLRTSLLSVLVTSRGFVLAGAVTPAVLYADAAALP